MDRPVYRKTTDHWTDRSTDHQPQTTERRAETPAPTGLPNTRDDSAGPTSRSSDARSKPTDRRPGRREPDGRLAARGPPGAHKGNASKQARPPLTLTTRDAAPVEAPRPAAREGRQGAPALDRATPPPLPPARPLGPSPAEPRQAPPSLPTSIGTHRNPPEPTGTRRATGALPPHRHRVGQEEKFAHRRLGGIA
ncbi:hypothetical protein GCM10010495_30840 [Kitasatospora herbaricolor]|nr:hypothetical protein GCM10010495_30840 [Kitasatospora herbaricolor]